MLSLKTAREGMRMAVELEFFVAKENA